MTSPESRLCLSRCTVQTLLARTRCQPWAWRQPTLATVQCGGKGKAFEKPGPHDRFKAGVRERARDMAQDRGHDPRYQKIVDTIEGVGPTPGWKKRAKVDVTPYYVAALQGRTPLHISSGCSKCKGDGHSHSTFCRTNPKDKEVDKVARRAVLKVVHSIAIEEAADQARRASVPPQHSQRSFFLCASLSVAVLLCCCASLRRR